MNKVHYTQCPVCFSNEINPLLTVKDYSVSGELFTVWQCNACTLRFTQDVPDEAAIGRYYKSEDYVSHTNTSKGVINKLYQKVRTFTLRQKKNLIVRQTGVERGAVLDVGAGVGAFLATMKEAGWQVTGIEPEETARSVAKRVFGINLNGSDALQDLRPASFDAITLWHVLEHVHELHRYIEALNSLLKPQGKLFIAVPNYRSLDADIYRLQWAAYDVPRHLYHFTPDAMEMLMQKHGLKIITRIPMWFDAFYISLLSSKYRNGRTNWPAAGWNGLRSNAAALLNPYRCSSLIYVAAKV